MAMLMNRAPQRLVVNDWAAFETKWLAFRNAAPAAGKTGLRTVATYRLYCLDGMGKVASAEWLEADDDTAAIGAAERQRGGRVCELWQGNRVVARFDAQGGR
jgi:hypothetical protein